MNNVGIENEFIHIFCIVLMRASVKKKFLQLFKGVLCNINGNYYSHSFIIKQLKGIVIISYIFVIIT